MRQCKHFSVMTFILVFFLASVVGGASEVSIGKRMTIESKVLKTEREFLVSLPMGYESSKESYPVLYAMDGDITFSYTASLVRYLAAFSPAVPGMIVVGVPHPDRFADLSYGKDKMLDHAVGGEDFAKFLETELFPYIGSTYRAKGYKVLYGHSLGAVFAPHTLARKPGLFNAYFSVSPDFTRDLTLLPLLQEKLSKKTLSDCFLFVAMEKFRSGEVKRGHEAFMALLRKLPKYRWTELFLEEENHVSMAPISLLHGLKTLFSGYEQTKKLPE